jgi:RNA-directed DNA polymerase
MRRDKKYPNIERYELTRSPFAQKPTQKEVAELLGETKGDLWRLINYKEQFVVRRTEDINGKVRDLAYPVDRLRSVHERLKFHLNKVKQPSYLFSPRKNRGQRDNALLHINQDQYLTLDLKQFYPSTTISMVRRFFLHDLGMYDDVAQLLTHLCTIDGKVSFGSPLTPVLCTLVHRRMFDAIAEVCGARGLRYSVWVDDLTISGKFIPGQVVSDIRSIVQSHGLRSHKIKYQSGNRPVFITGIGVVGPKLIAPNALNLRIKNHWNDLHAATTLDEKESCTQRLLSQLGTIRHITGSNSITGRKAADQMNAIRQKRNKLYRVAQELSRQHLATAQTDILTPQDTPF